ncbi:MAG: PepSY domain-containing protein [Candidatus Pristimantibacillus sp.]
MKLHMNRKFWMMGSIILLVVLILIMVLLPRTGKELKLSREAAENEVLSHYDGQIVESLIEGEAYLIKLKAATGLYEFTVAGDGTGVSAIRSLERYGNADEGNQTSIPSPDPTPSPPSSPDTSPTPNPSVLITEEEASTLALAKVQGVVQDVDVEQTDGKWYYFVEIDTSDGREADIQLNAASGAVVSVTWDDDDDHDDN